MKLIVSKKEAQEMIKASSDEMLMLLQSGEIPAYKVGRNWKIPVKCLEDYVVSRAIKETELRNGQ